MTNLGEVADLTAILASWSAGLFGVSGAVAWAKISGRGFGLVAGSLALLIGIPSLFDDPAWLAWTALALAAIALVGVRNPLSFGLLQIVAGVLLLAQASTTVGILPGLSATLLLGGVTGEMLLGHWYLVDPRMPRSALRGLAAIGIAGVVTDTIIITWAGMPGGGASLTFYVLMGTTAVLMVGVMAALRYPAYSGVMAATGLSYLAVLTTLGGVFLGRALVAGLGPFAS